MSDVPVKSFPDTAQKSILPVFEEIGKRIDMVRQRALELFERRGREFGHALDDWLKAEREIMGSWPAAELKEKDGAYELEMTLPGYQAKEVEVTATPSEIIVHAQTQHEEKKEEEGQVVWTEFGSNEVFRRFELPQPIEVEKATASLDKGILHVMAPKAPEAKKRTIEVAA
jgi:HSP20 family molecular chaperone IbpA